MEVAECSVCQFVKSNCLIGFDQGDGWFGADRRNSGLLFTKKRQIEEGSLRYWDQILRISLKDWGYHWGIREITWVWRPGSQIGGRPCSCRCSCTRAWLQKIFYSLIFFTAWLRKIFLQFDFSLQLCDILSLIIFFTVLCEVLISTIAWHFSSDQFCDILTISTIF